MSAVIPFPPERRIRNVQPRVPGLWECVLLLQRAMEKNPERFDILERGVIKQANDSTRKILGTRISTS